MMMIHLSKTQPNMSSIGAVCDSLGKTFLTLLLGSLGATGGLWVNSSSVKGRLIIFPLFLLEGNAILPMTPKADCGHSLSVLKKAKFKFGDGQDQVKAIYKSHEDRQIQALPLKKNLIFRSHSPPWLDPVI